MINHEHKFIFIHIPKCAGMSVGRTLYELTGKYSKTYEGFKIHHDEFDSKIWEEYFVFTLFRRPKAMQNPVFSSNKGRKVSLF